MSLDSSKVAGAARDAANLIFSLKERVGVLKRDVEDAGFGSMPADLDPAVYVKRSKEHYQMLGEALDYIERLTDTASHQAEAMEKAVAEARDAALEPGDTEGFFRFELFKEHHVRQMGAGVKYYAKLADRMYRGNVTGYDYSFTADADGATFSGYNSVTLNQVELYTVNGWEELRMPLKKFTPHDNVKFYTRSMV